MQSSPPANESGTCIQDGCAEEAQYMTGKLGMDVEPDALVEGLRKQIVQTVINEIESKLNDHKEPVRLNVYLSQKRAGFFRWKNSSV